MRRPRITALLLALSAAVAVYAQAPSATIRVTVHSAANPVPDATVAFNRVSLRTDRDGIAIAPIVLGQTEINGPIVGSEIFS